MRKFSILVLSVFALITFALSLTEFDVKTFKGQYTLISLERLLQTDEFVSVEGVVYRIEASKKFLTKEEVPSQLLNEANLVGLLAIGIDELGTFTGKDRPALVAVNGIVYDVTNSRQWAGGSHRNRHRAGEELTHELIKNSPHGVARLSRIKPFGILVFTPKQLSKFNGQNQRAHIAFRGVVYDMSHLKPLPNYPFGTEASYELLGTPNYSETLEKSYAIGLLVFDEQSLAQFDGKTVKISTGEAFKEFIKVGNVVYDVTEISNWREKLHLEPDAPAGKDYTSQFECELEETCTHEHVETEVLKEFRIVGFELVK